MAEMPEDYSAFTPPQAQPAPGGIAEQWDGFLADPRGRAALASFGVQLMQPLSAGQSGFGHLGASLGQAGASVRGTEALDLKEFEADSRAELRGSQAATAEARANTAATRAAALNSETDSRIVLRGAQAETARANAAYLEMKVDQLKALVAAFPDDQEAKRQLLNTNTLLAQARADAVPYDSDTRRMAVEGRNSTAGLMLDVKKQDADTRSRRADSQTTIGTERNAISREREANRRTVIPSDSEGSRNERNRTSNLLRAQAQHQKALGEIQKRNNNPLRAKGTSEEPMLSFQEWLNANPPVRDALKVGAPAPAPLPAAVTTPTPAAAAPAPAPAPAAELRVPNNIYPTPKGPLRWTGTGWVAP